MKYKVGDQVEARDYHGKGCLWGLAMIVSCRPDFPDRYIVHFDRSPPDESILLRSCDIRPRQESANAT